METDHIFINTKKVTLSKPLPLGSEIKLIDISYEVNALAEFFSMRIHGYIPSPSYFDSRSKGHIFTFRIPMNKMTFSDFKKSCLSQCEHITSFSERVLIRDIIKRFTLVGGKVKFSRIQQGFPIFKMRLSADLSRALGFPGKECSVDSYGDIIFSKFLENYDKNTLQGFMHFPTKKLVSIKCHEIDVSKHFDNNLYNFFIQKANTFCVYKQPDSSLFFKVTPTKHMTLNLAWPNYIVIKNITLGLKIPHLTYNSR